MQDVVIVAATRTAVGSFQGSLAGIPAPELGAAVIRRLLEQTSLADYVRNSTRLRHAMAPHLVALLRTGVSVVLDFPANTLVSRAWIRTLVEEAGVAHQLHYLDVPDGICKARLRQRDAGGEHEFIVSDEEFDLFTRHFVAPSPDEGFNIVLHRQ